MTESSITMRPIGRVRSTLTDPAAAPRQPDEGAPSAWLEMEPDVAAGLADLAAGDAVLVLTWLERADRSVLRVHPRDDPTNPLTGVFSTRSADRPNPIGIHAVSVVRVDGTRVLVDHLEAVDDTPVVDLKPDIGRSRRSESSPSGRG